MFLSPACRRCVLIAILVLAISPPAAAETPSDDFLPAFPGAVGQGAAATGGRGGDVYHVTTLEDYNSDRGEPKIEGSLRHAIRSADRPRTIVFEVGGPIALRCPLKIMKDDLTIAGQTSPGGITLWGYPLAISRASNVIVRFLRVRTGDFHAQRPQGGEVPPESNNDLPPASANGVSVTDCDLIILDHLSVTWGIDETLSVTKSRNVTVQNCIIAESLNDSFHPKGEHGYGSLVRGELTPADQEAGEGGYTFYGNLWAHHRARNPSIGGQQRLDPSQPEAERRRSDVNLVNNVIYNWSDQATHRSQHGDVRINLVGNYYINGPARASKHFFRGGGPGRTFVYHRGNYHDADQDALHDGMLIQAPEQVERAFDRLGPGDLLQSDEPFRFLANVADRVLSAKAAYERVVDSAGASLSRDVIDQRVIDSLLRRIDGHIDSQEELRDEQGCLPGIDDLPVTHRPHDFDTDRDGIDDQFELAHGLDPTDPADANDTTLSPEGYTNLEVYLNSLAEQITRRRHGTSRTRSSLNSMGAPSDSRQR